MLDLPSPKVLFTTALVIFVGVFSGFIKFHSNEPTAQVVETSNTESQPQEAASEIPETLEIVYQKDGDGYIHYILRDNETGYEYIVVERHYAARGGSVSVTPRLGIKGRDKASHLNQ